MASALLGLLTFACEARETSLPPAPLDREPIEYVNPFIGTGGAGFAQGNAVVGPSADGNHTVIFMQHLS